MAPYDDPTLPFLLLLIDFYSSTIHPFLYLNLYVGDLRILYRECNEARESVANYSHLTSQITDDFQREIVLSNEVSLFVCQEYNKVVLDLQANNVSEPRIRLAERTGTPND